MAPKRTGVPAVASTPAKVMPAKKAETSDEKSSMLALAAAPSVPSRAASSKGWANEKLTSVRSLAVSAVSNVSVRVRTIVSDKTAQVTGASLLCGGTVGGAAGAAVGAVTGGSFGLVVGLVPAVFTFGMSIPVGAAMGSGCGVVLGSVAGSTVGGVGAGAAGYGAYKHRIEVRDMFATVRTRVAARSAKLTSSMKVLKAKAAAKLAHAQEFASARAASVRTQVNAWAVAATTQISSVAKSAHAKTRTIVSEKSVQVSAASAAGGAAVLGSGGAAAGLATGGALGFLSGLVLAPLTLGLSIPVATTVGGGCGLVSGAAVGSAAGGVGGGALGYMAYVKRQAIGGAASATLKKVDSFSKTMRSSATESAQYVRARLMGGTGGSA